jgi:hypothetical protein
MNSKQVVIGIFENEMYAIIAKRDLRSVGIKANIMKEGGGVTLNLLKQAEGIQLMVSDAQVEEAKKILKTKFN